jgi:homoserine dehydrogenase
VPSAPVRIRVSIVGLGVVGAWLLGAIDRHRDRLRDEYGLALSVVALASRRDGFVHREDGIEIADALALRARGASIAELPGARHWPTALAGLEATETDVLVEVSQSPAAGGEPGLAHLRHALRRGVSAATSNKWPVALAGVELRELAERHRAGLRAESTVMSGTPVLAALTTGLGGATPLRLRGVLNATVNLICSRIAAGGTYAEALAEAQAAGLAEPDPTADVDGFDTVAKLMVLSALVFGVQLEIGDVARRGISQLADADIEGARARGLRIRELATLDVDGGRAAVVEPSPLSPGDPFFDVEDTTNAIRLEVDPIGEVGISGPGAGPKQAGQGVFSDLVALARERAGRSG